MQAPDLMGIQKTSGPPVQPHSTVEAEVARYQEPLPVHFDNHNEEQITAFEDGAHTLGSFMSAPAATWHSSHRTLTPGQALRSASGSLGQSRPPTHDSRPQTYCDRSYDVAAQSCRYSGFLEADHPSLLQQEFE